LAGYGVQETQKQLDAMFAQGKVGFWFSGAWLLNKIKSENPTMRFGVAVMPSMVASAGTDTSPGMSFAGGEYIAVNAKSQQNAAVEFAKFITDGINAIEFCKMIPEAGFPCDKNYFNDEFYQTQALRAVFAAQLKYAKMTPVHPKWLKMEAIIENALEQVLYAKQSPELALQEAHEEIERIIKRAKSRE
jgi:maltose-binding protein MalE